jgi:hypothetical protein
MLAAGPRRVNASGSTGRACHTIATSGLLPRLAVIGARADPPGQPRGVGGDAVSSGHVMPGQDEPKDFAPVTEEEQEVLLRVIEVLRKLSYGTILLVVQDGRVVQIETAEKIRLR